MDFNALAQKAESIFTVLSDCSCGITADESGEYIVLAASVQQELTDSEMQIMENWLKSESGIAQARLFLSE